MRRHRTYDDRTKRRTPHQQDALERPWAQDATARPIALATWTLVLIAALVGCRPTPVAPPPPPDPGQAIAYARESRIAALRAAEGTVQAELRHIASRRIHSVNRMTDGLQRLVEAAREAVPRTRAFDSEHVATLDGTVAALERDIRELQTEHWLMNNPHLAAWASSAETLLADWVTLSRALRRSDYAAADAAYENFIETWLQVRERTRAFSDTGRDTAFWF